MLRPKRTQFYCRCWPWLILGEFRAIPPYGAQSLEERRSRVRIAIALGSGRVRARLADKPVAHYLRRIEELLSHSRDLVSQLLFCPHRITDDWGKGASKSEQKCNQRDSLSVISYW